MPIIEPSGGGGSGTVTIVGFGQHTDDLSTAGTTYGTGADVLTAAITFTANGTSQYAVIMMGPGQVNSTAAAVNEAALNLDGAQSVFMMDTQLPNNAGNVALPLLAVGVISPSAGSHTVNVKFFVSGGTGKLLGSTALTGATGVLVIVVRLN